MYWVRLLEESAVGRIFGGIVAAAVLLGGVWHGLSALCRLLF